MLSREEILAKRLKERVVEIPGVGQVKVRALTRDQVVKIRSDGEMDIAEMEQKLITAGLVEPQLSAEDVKAWYEGSPAGELSPVSEAITELSGLSVTAAKSDVPSV